MNVYCQNCGKATEYSLNKPRFCAFCAFPFDNVAKATVSPPVSAPPPPVRQPQVAPKVENEEMDFSLDDDGDGEPIIESASPNLEVEIVHGPRNTMKIGELASGAKIDREEIKTMRPKGPKLSKKKFLEQFAQQAGALRPQTKVHRVKSEA